MAEDTSIRPKLLVVEEIRDNAATTIIFEGGIIGKLPKSGKYYHDYLLLAQKNLQRNFPVAVKLAEPDTITEMESGDNDVVKKYVERDKESMEIWFHGHDGIFFLRRDHPDFKRISEVLNRSIKEKKRVWFVAGLPLLSLEDVILHEPRDASTKKESGPLTSQVLTPFSDRPQAAEKRTMSRLLKMPARFHLTSAHLVLTYEVTNLDTRDAYLLNRIYRTVPAWEMTPDVVYIHLDPKAETVWLNKKLADLPDGVRITSPVAPFVTPVRAGSSFREEVKVPLPVQEYRQYSLPTDDDEEDEPVLVPRVYRHVYFTLGYYWRPEGTIEKTQDVQGTEVVLPQTPPGVPLEFGELHTDRKRLDIPVLEPAAAGNKASG